MVGCMRTEGILHLGHLPEESTPTIRPPLQSISSSVRKSFLGLTSVPPAASQPKVVLSSSVLEEVACSPGPGPSSPRRPGQWSLEPKPTNNNSSQNTSTSQRWLPGDSCCFVCLVSHGTHAHSPSPTRPSQGQAQPRLQSFQTAAYSSPGPALP